MVNSISFNLDKNIDSELIYAFSSAYKEEFKFIKKNYIHTWEYIIYTIKNENKIEFESLSNFLEKKVWQFENANNCYIHNSQKFVEYDIKNFIKQKLKNAFNKKFINKISYLPDDEIIKITSKVVKQILNKENNVCSNYIIIRSRKKSKNKKILP